MKNRSKNLGKFANKGAIPWNKGLKGFGKTHFLGKKHSELSKEKMRKSSLGKKHTEEAKNKISESLLGNDRGKFNKGRASKMKGVMISNETKMKISLSLKGKTSPNKGKKTSEETRKKLSEALKGSKSPHWKGGVTPINEAIRKSFEYKIWREAVFKRDGWTCVKCFRKNSKGMKIIIHADHIKPFAYFPELRFNVENGRTLCIDCHKNTETYGNKKR